jgi:hypothetical protein
MKERWRWIKGYKGLYKVSDFGRVKSVDRVIEVGGKLRRVKGQHLTPVIRNKKNAPYLFVSLPNLFHRKKNLLVHRLVAIAFVPNSDPSLTFINHKDTNKENNHWTNLEWTTIPGNVAHAVENGIHCRGSKIGVSKLTETDIPLIRKLLKKGRSKTSIGQRFGVHVCTISDIAHKRTWTHV